MAQIEQSDGGKKKKGAQKKMHIHVDFTPMVDMNMLLITFFMLCTTMIKSQTLNIALPAPPDENATVENSETVGESTALTMIIDTERDDNGAIITDGAGKPSNIIYWYAGFEPTIENGVVTEHKLGAEKFVGNTSEGNKTVYNGIRSILHERNKEVLDAIDELKVKWRNKEIDDEQFNEQAREIRNNADFKNRPQVTIKATDRASWESVISALDEMQINQISQYRIGTFTPTDSILIADYRQQNGLK